MKITLVLLFTAFTAFLAGCPDNSKPGTTPAASGTTATTATAPPASASAGSGW
jgi:hypothetical protein